MTAPSNMSGVMHCWFMAKAECGGRTYVALRGVNWDGRYDRQFDFAPQNTPWWHVPTSKFEYDPGDVPCANEALDKVELLLAKEWPALADADIVNVDQNIAGDWGGADRQNRTEAVTRVAFDFGHVTSLPEIKLKPGQNLDWPRHPVTWVPADEIFELKQSLQQARQVSPYLVTAQSVSMENADKKPQQVVAKNLLLQATVAVMFVDSFGPVFRPQSAGKSIHRFVLSTLSHNRLFSRRFIRASIRHDRISNRSRSDNRQRNSVGSHPGQ